MSEQSDVLASTLSLSLAETQHQWLLPARARLLRLAGIARRQQVLELGAGQGLATAELIERSGGHVTAVDIHADQVAATRHRCGSTVEAICADAHELPFSDASFDLAFAQFTCLWLENIEKVVLELQRVLVEGGALVAIEPDYEAMIQWPNDLGLRELWVETLAAAGAHTSAGRALVGTCQRLGFQTQVLFADRLFAWDSASLDFLRPLLKTGHDSRPREAELRRLEERLQEDDCVVHLPLFLVFASKT